MNKRVKNRVAQISDNLHFRLILAHDLYDFVQIWNQQSTVLTESQKQFTFDSITQRYMDRGDHVYYGCFLRNKLNGFVICRAETDIFWIKFFAIENSFQNLGIGTKLLEFACNLAKKSQVIKTEVLIPNIQGLNFFLHHGFSIKEFHSGEPSEYVLKFD